MKLKNITSKSSGSLLIIDNTLTKKYSLIILTIIAGYALLFNDLIVFKGICIFKSITGLPCPGCGMTRSSTALFSGKFVESLSINPLAVLFHVFVLIVVFWIIRDLIYKKETLIPVLKKNPPFYSIAILFSLLIANWIWNIAKGL